MIPSANCARHVARHSLLRSARTLPQHKSMYGMSAMLPRTFIRDPTANHLLRGKGLVISC
jgi:hypothetical protein